MLTVKDLEITETVYEKIPYYENRDGVIIYVKKKGVSGTDYVTNKYNSLFYSNYYEVATEFDDDEQYTEYMNDLSSNGNELPENIRINKFLNKLSDI